MINHFASQSPANFWKIFFFTLKLGKVVQSRVEPMRINFKIWSSHYLSTNNNLNACHVSLGARIYIYIYFLVSRFSDLSRYISKLKFTGWAIIEQLSIRRRLRTFLISWGRKTHVKHCYVDLSSWYEFWFAIICISINIISNLSTAFPQFKRRFRFIASKWVNTGDMFGFFFNYNDRE